MKVIIFALAAVLALVVAEDCPCTYEYNPVCGSNGQTYSNPCQLRCAQQTYADLRFFYPGNCGTPNFDCPCTREFRPVCGTNGFTYNNPCLFRCAKETFDSIEIAYEGFCGNPVETRILDCPCTREYRPVCATNGVTYSNPCLFRCAKKTFEFIEIAYSGECGNPRETRNLDCPCTKEYDPVCATNGVTYANPCLFRCAKKTYHSIEIAYSGKCLQ